MYILKNQNYFFYYSPLEQNTGYFSEYFEHKQMVKTGKVQEIKSYPKI